MPHKRFINYQKERDILFVFGAGASIADGGILQKDLLPKIFEIDEVSETVSLVKEFIEDNFFVKDKSFPSLESVFGYLDHFISKNESLGKKYTKKEILQIKETLVRLIHYVISRSNSTKTAYFHFWKRLSKSTLNISVITMNYDTLLDEAFDFLYPDIALIDYCIHLMNYEDYQGLSAFNWWDNPREPVAIWDENQPKPIKVLKIHGSLNWKYCNCCNQVYLTPWDTQIDLKTQRFKERLASPWSNHESVEKDLLCPYDGNSFDTFIVPPSHIKNLWHPVISKLLDEAAIEIRKARKVVFIGYSFPEADVHIKALFKKNLPKDAEIEVVNPLINDEIKHNYMSLSSSTTFIRKSFETYVQEHL